MGSHISRKEEFGFHPMSTCGIRKEWESIGVVANGTSLGVGKEG